MRGRHKRGRSRHRARQRAGETLPRRARHSECSVCCVRGSCAPDGCRPGHRAGERRMSIQSLRAAMAFLTVIPVATAEGTSGERLGRAYFPAVGALLGLVAGIAFALSAAVTSPLIAAVAATTVMAVLTGALHLDGLADAADGLFGGGDLPRRLEVMRDSRVGSFGLVAVVLVLLGDVAALAAMPPVRALIALVIAAVPYVRHAGLGVAAGGPHRRFDLGLGSAITVIPCLLDWRRALASLL